MNIIDLLLFGTLDWYGISDPNFDYNHEGKPYCYQKKKREKFKDYNPYNILQYVCMRRKVLRI
jgi:hypothetical protein